MRLASERSTATVLHQSTTIANLPDETEKDLSHFCSHSSKSQGERRESARATERKKARRKQQSHFGLPAKNDEIKAIR